MAQPPAQHRGLLQQHRAYLNKLLADDSDWTIDDGPFQGMKLPKSYERFYSMLGPAILGCFEQETHGFIDAWADRKYDAVINVGMAEGYYLVGLGRRYPDARLIGYEQLEELWPIAKETAYLNTMAERLETRGVCDPETLKQVAGSFSAPLIIMDIEGAEVDFLSPSHAQNFAHADVIVECHDGKRDSATEHVKAALALNHKVTVVPEGGRNPNSMRLLTGWSQVNRWLMMWEGRGTFCTWIGADHLG